MSIPNAKIRSALRKLWMYSPERKEAMNQARSGRGFYECARCKEVHHRSNVSVDHIQPVGSHKQGWDGLIDRMFVPVDGLRVLCNECHKIVTNKGRKK
jgi:hypothetical protein